MPFVAQPTVWALLWSNVAYAFINVPLLRTPDDHALLAQGLGMAVVRPALAKKEMMNTNLGRRPSLAYATVYVGTPPQALYLQIDTGSSDFVIAGAECVDCGVARPFRCNESTTCHPQLCGSHRPYRVCKFQMTYGSGGHITGDVIEDQFALSVEQGSMTSGVYIDMVKSCHPKRFFSSRYYNGIFGLGPDASTGSTLPSPLGMLLQEQHLPNVFSIYTGSTIKRVAGVLTLGGFDPHAFVGRIQYVPMARAGCEAWEYCAEPMGLVVNGQDVVADSRDFGVTLIDSGTTLTLLPEKVMHQVQTFFQRHYCHLPLVCGPRGKTLFDGHCIKAPTLPEGFPVMEWQWRHGVVLKVPPEAYFLKQTSRKHRTSFCFGLAGVPKSPGNPDSTLGDTFMAAAYVVFDRHQRRIGFAAPDWVPFATGDAASWQPVILAFGFTAVVFLAAAAMLYASLHRRPDVVSEGTDTSIASLYGSLRRSFAGWSRGRINTGVGSESVFEGY